MWRKMLTLSAAVALCGCTEVLPSPQDPINHMKDSPTLGHGPPKFDAEEIAVRLDRIWREELCERPTQEALPNRSEESVSLVQQVVERATNFHPGILQMVEIERRTHLFLREARLSACNGIECKCPQQVQGKDFEFARRRLCPIWPFCS